MFKIATLWRVTGSVASPPEPGWRWPIGLTASRGRHRELVIAGRVLGLEIELSGPGASYRKLVGAPRFLADLDWVLDEFDASFNELATASLRYHLDYSYADNEIHRTRFESLIDRLSEPEPALDELEGFVDDGTGGFRDVVDPETGASRFVYEPSARMREYAERFEQAHAEYQRRITAARHDFVDVIPLLWS